MKMRYFLFLLLSLPFVMCSSCEKDEPGDDSIELEEGVYYIDDVNGNDNNSGNSPEDAWKSVSNINKTPFKAGDKILFKAGGTWSGVISPKGNGTEELPVVFNSYGDGDKPVINGEARQPFTIKIDNQEYIEFHNLKITNQGVEQGVEDDLRCGIHVYAEDLGEVNHIHLKNLEVCDVNGFYGPSGKAFGKGKRNGGIYVEIAGDKTPTYFNDFLLEDCYIHDVEQSGFTNVSVWDNRTLNENIDWTPSTNMVIRGNTFERIAGNGLIIRVAKSPLIENNLFTHCGQLTTGNASFSFNTDDALWQYNEACYTKNATGNDVDAGGFDSDYRSKRTIFQFNYSHDNEHGGILITGGPNLSSQPFNDGTIVRYNVFENNASHIIRTSGNVTNLLIHNNVFFTGDEIDDMKYGIFYHKKWGYASRGTEYYNNIVYSKLGCKVFNNDGGSINNVFDNNIFYFFNNNGEAIPSGNDNITEDPQFLFGVDGALKFQLKDRSPAIDVGLDVGSDLNNDFAGNAIPVNALFDIGAFEKQ